MFANRFNDNYPLYNLVLMNLVVSSLALVIGIFLMASRLEMLSKPASGQNWIHGKTMSGFTELREEHLATLLEAVDDCPVWVLVLGEEEMTAYAPGCQSEESQNQPQANVLTLPFSPWPGTQDSNRLEQSI